MRIADLIHGLDVKIVNAAGGGESGGAAGAGELSDLRVCDITEDSRTVMPGSLFIARQGEKSDGKAFVAGAIKAGAAAVLTDDPGFQLPGDAKSVALLNSRDVYLAIAQLAERFYGDPSSKMTVIGVTGTNGKTTITFLIHQMLNALGIRCGLIGTVVIDDGVETAPASLTTPPALEVSRTFARMHDAGCSAAVMEVSSHALHQRRVGATNFNAGVFTNLTGDHLDYHKTMEEYASAKAMLFEALPADGVAVVNIQDSWHSRMAQWTKARIVRCAVDEAGALVVSGGTAPETVCRARVVGADTSGTDVEFTGPWGHRRVRVPLVGAFNVMNALQAIATVHALFGGTDEDALSFEIIAQALERASAPPGRLEPVTADGAPIQVFVDYAHSDDALKTVLGVLRGAMKKGVGRLWCVFGCGGDRDRTKRPRMGKVAAEMADCVVVTSDNPRTEDPGAIIAETLAGVTGDRKGVVVEPDRDAAIRRAIGEALPGDTIIIAGKGHEDYQILPDPAKKGGTITRHFDDREVARAALREHGIAVREAAKTAANDENDGGEDLTAGASLALGG